MKNANILGAIAGDVIGSIYEFNPTKDYHFNMFDERMEYTDDSIMTIAVADWLLNCPKLDRLSLAKTMREWGNGSAMRVSPVGFVCHTLEETLRIAQLSAEITHNHPEGIKGAQATAAAIFLARTGSSKEYIRNYISHTFGYELNKTCCDIREHYRFEESCQETVPQSIIAFLDSKNYEDAIRLTVSLGGDADTMGAITGGIAAAFYKEIPDEIYTFVWEKLPNDMQAIVTAFENKIRI